MNQLYVGREYARDLSPSEIKQLKEFDTKMSAYQKYVSESIHQQVQSLFGGMNSDLWSLLGDPAPATTEIPSDSTTALAPVEAPEAPSFCVAIY
ncbi:unnamed protein product [Anisakis simplex]|uniref:Pepsin inhibitor-3-like repeated domain-containing protein n=1 Tax=Anisakis simplex TaxID=6269 RepID=A0A3P6PKD0_ANISI|nr:unnamed protein product [Anisakis simplex]